MDNYKNFLNESETNEFKVGDIVCPIDRGDCGKSYTDFLNELGCGVITSIYKVNYVSVLWDNGRIVDFNKSNLVLSKNNKKGTRITRPDIDPFNEEDWGWEVNGGYEDFYFSVGDVVKMRDDSKHKHQAYNYGGDGFGEIVELRGLADRRDPDVV